MKKIFLTVIALIASYCTYAQTNTFPTSGSAGVGTTSPRANLEVNTAATTGATIITANNGSAGTSAAPVYLRNDFVGYNYAAWGPDARIEIRDRAFNYAQSDMNFLVRNPSNVLTSTMFIDGVAGNIGIGNTTPIAKLDVTNILSGVHSTNPSLFRTSDLYNAGANGQYFQIIGAGDGTNYTNINLISNWGYLSLGARADGAVTPTNSLNILSNGNIGIGTTTPTSLLHLQNANVPMISLYKTGVITWKIGNFDQLTDNGFTIGFNTTKAFYINSGGSVGIGTTSPTYPLTVGGPATSLSGEETSILYLPTQTGGSYGGTVSQTLATPTAVSSATYYGSYAESGDNTGITFNLTGATGLVGVGGGIVHRGTGTVTGSASLYAGGASSLNGGTITTAYGVYVNTIKNTGVTNSYGIYQSSANDKNYFAGNLGVGVTTPTSTLHLIDNTTPVGGTSGMLPSTTATPNGSIMLGATGTSLVSTMGLYVASGVTPYFWIQPRNSSTVTYYNTVLNPNGGSVAIGTSNPAGYMFAVNGSAVATSMTVKLNVNWPDYVFKKDYQLASLQEVKTYIDQNHHLPEMPSAEQISKDGLNLGEMNKLLTKKVEELTLYLIEKDQQQKKQADELKMQQDEIQQLKEQVQILIKTTKNN
jgi:hypothetical protein